MKRFGRFSKIIVGALALGVLLSASAVQASVGKAVVRAVRGSADFSSGDGQWKVLKVGRNLRPGAIIRTHAESEVDLFLGVNGPVVRVTENTQLGLDALTYQEVGDDIPVINTRLDLEAGRILGNVKKMAAASKYEVETPNGVAGIRGTEYDISADGTIRVISGTVVFNFQPPGAQISTQIINAGQAFDPNTGQVIDIPANIIDQLTAEFTDIGALPEIKRPPQVPTPENEPEELPEDTATDDSTKDSPYGPKGRR
jgi:hypothetical protein